MWPAILLVSIAAAVAVFILGAVWLFRAVRRAEQRIAEMLAPEPIMALETGAALRSRWGTWRHGAVARSPSSLAFAAWWPARDVRVPHAAIETVQVLHDAKKPPVLRVVSRTEGGGSMSGKVELRVRDPERWAEMLCPQPAPVRPRQPERIARTSTGRFAGRVCTRFVMKSVPADGEHVLHVCFEDDHDERWHVSFGEDEDRWRLDRIDSLPPGIEWPEPGATRVETFRWDDEERVVGRRLGGFREGIVRGLPTAVLDFGDGASLTLNYFAARGADYQITWRHNRREGPPPF